MSSNKDITNFAAEDGQFRRGASVFRDWISSKPGAKFPPEKGRYHLIISHACPWANRTAIVRNLKGLQQVISLSVVHWYMGPKGWSFDPSVAGATEEPLYGKKYLREFYFQVNPGYEGRFTVPMLWDKKQETIVNNESSEIIRMLYHEFDDFVSDEHKKADLYPGRLAKQIDDMNSWVYDTVSRTSQGLTDSFR